MKFRFDKNALVMFDESNGTKIRFSLGKYHKATYPELVDIKITDYCIFGCSFCYQGSTPQGQHATYDNIKYIINELSRRKVFEVAIGGGEPTDHPDFIEILSEFRKAGIVPNFTTRAMGYVKRNWDRLSPLIGAFAFSADKVSDLDSAAKMFKNIPNDRINIHYIMGLCSPSEYIKFMSRAKELGYRVTLLGYKSTGRGGDVTPVPYDWWIRVTQRLIQANQCPTFSIDTPLAEQFQDRLPVSKKMFHTREGFVSAYIDAVSMKMGASSFENLTNLVPFDDNWVSRYRTI